MESLKERNLAFLSVETLTGNDHINMSLYFEKIRSANMIAGENVGLKFILPSGTQRLCSSYLVYLLFRIVK